MPRRDRITINGHTKWGLNVFDTVGLRGANRPGDVMVVQAMFSYLNELWSRGVMKHASSPDFDLQVNGIFGAKTQRAIFRFQRHFDYVVLSVDGTIHPAKYENRNILFGDGNGGRLMTITFLHTELWSAEHSENRDDYTISIAKKFPEVAFWIGPLPK